MGPGEADLIREPYLPSGSIIRASVKVCRILPESMKNAYEVFQWQSLSIDRSILGMDDWQGLKDSICLRLRMGFIEGISCSWKVLSRFARRLFLLHPVKTVLLHRFRPVLNSDGRWTWTKCFDNRFRHHLPKKLFDLLPQWPGCPLDYGEERSFGNGDFTSACVALGHTCVKYGRKAAGIVVAPVLSSGDR